MNFTSRHHTILAVIFMLLLLAGLTVWYRADFRSNGSVDSPVGEFWGTIYGTVLLGPVCPVVMDPPDPQCADKPYQTRLSLTTADGSRVIKEFGSDADGRFSVEVPPGEYAIRSATVANILPYCASNGIITLKVNDSIEVAVSCDTGIR